MSGSARHAAARPAAGPSSVWTIEQIMDFLMHHDMAPQVRARFSRTRAIAPARMADSHAHRFDPAPLAARVTPRRRTSSDGRTSSALPKGMRARRPAASHPNLLRERGTLPRPRARDPLFGARSSKLELRYDLMKLRENVRAAWTADEIAACDRALRDLITPQLLSEQSMSVFYPSQLKVRRAPRAAARGSRDDASLSLSRVRRRSASKPRSRPCARRSSPRASTCAGSTTTLGPRPRCSAPTR